jgi:Kef-type K+ transport system membrane component KefB
MGDDNRSEEEVQRDRQMTELLQELRIALPGVQILFAFLLTVPFAMGFQKTTPFQRDLYFVTLLATAASTICLIAPSATHRLRFHKGDRKYVIETAHRYTIAGLIFLAIAIVLALVMVTDVLYNGAAIFAFPAGIALLLLGVWFVRPLLRGWKENARR